MLEKFCALLGVLVILTKGRFEMLGYYNAMEKQWSCTELIFIAIYNGKR